MCKGPEVGARLVCLRSGKDASVAEGQQAREKG